MKAFLVLVCFVVSFSACLANNKNNDDPIINGGTVTDAPVTEINQLSTNDTIDPPIGPSPPPTTTISPNTTTHKPNTTTIPTTTTSTTTTTTSTTTTTPKPSTTTSATTTSTTTTSTTTTAETPVPITTTTTPAPHPERKFDGPSFVGGMILALGLVAIGFVAFRFYKARTEMNYHTL